MRKLAFTLLVLVAGVMITSCATSRRGGGGGKGKCPAYTQVDQGQTEDSRS